MNTNEEQKPPIGWIVESAEGDGKPYLTLKGDVAVKRTKAGDHVTPYYSKRDANAEDEL